MFAALFDLVMAPINFVRKTFGWMPEDGEIVTDDGAGSASLQEATIANGGPSASTFSSLRESTYGEDDATDGSNSELSFSSAVPEGAMGLSIYVPDIITTEDWQTLSMAQIDAKLIAAGERPIGDPVGDPFYDLTPLEVAELTDDEFQALLDQVNWGDEEPYWEGVITDDDWATLSMAEIDGKLEAAGLAPIGDPTGDPFYDMTPEEVDALSDEEYVATMQAFGWDDVIFPGWEDTITVTDLETLSAAEIEAKLMAAGFETVGQEDSPFYNLSDDDVQLLPDTAVDQLLVEETELYTSLGYATVTKEGSDTEKVDFLIERTDESIPSNETEYTTQTVDEWMY